MSLGPGPFASPPMIDAHQLREWAEAASSRRDGNPFWLVHHEGKVATIVSAMHPPAGAVLGVKTREVEKRPKPSAVIIECGGDPFELTKQYDAVFWSEAAVEKFVLPYYASKSLWDAASVLDKLACHWYGRIPGEPDVGQEVGPVPFALAHTPDSDWNALSADGTSSAGSELHLLFKEGDGVRPVALSDLESPRRGERAGLPPHTPAATAGG